MALRDIDWEGLKKILRQPPRNLKLVDVREPKEYAAGAIPTAVNVPLAYVPSFLNTLKGSSAKQTPLIFYCLSGVRASKAADLAAMNGFTEVMLYKGSYGEYSKLSEEDKKF
jgi:rhodanese-related sulfurtransferase